MNLLRTNHRQMKFTILVFPFILSTVDASGIASSSSDNVLRRKQNRKVWNNCQTAVCCLDRDDYWSVISYHRHAGFATGGGPSLRICMRTKLKSTNRAGDSIHYDNSREAFLLCRDLHCYLSTSLNKDIV